VPTKLLIANQLEEQDDSVHGLITHHLEAPGIVHLHEPGRMHCSVQLQGNAVATLSDRCMHRTTSQKKVWLEKE
jgi:hypothetical protein